MSTYNIDKSIPVPTSRNYSLGKRATKYPFAQMEVGDSFFIPLEDKRKKLGKIQSYVLSLARLYSKKTTGFSVQSAQIEENGIKGVRVWRIAKEEK